jgi:3-oxoisoapionate decarboxylase
MPVSRQLMRRTFLQSAGLAAAASATPLSPSGIRLGIDAYSLRALNWKALKLIEYAASQRLDVVQLSGLPAYESLEPGHLRLLRERAAAAGVSLEVGIGSICETSAGWKPTYGTPVEYMSKAIRVAQAIGSPVIKAYLGGSADRSTATPLARHIEETLKTLKAVRSMAVDHGVKIAMENHSGDLLARELRDLIETAGKDWVGCNLDSGNPMMTLEDPLLALEILGPYTLTTHIRDSVLFEHPRGAAWQWVAMGDGVVNWPLFIERYKKLCPQAPFLLENITGRPPHVVPFLEKEFWKPFPNVLASDFASYVSLARTGKPLMNRMIIADVPGDIPPEYKQALVAQQKVDLEKGLEFARNQLGLGVNCRT